MSFAVTFLTDAIARERKWLEHSRTNIRDLEAQAAEMRLHEARHLKNIAELEAAALTLRGPAPLGE